MSGLLSFARGEHRFSVDETFEVAALDEARSEKVGKSLLESASLGERLSEPQGDGKYKFRGKVGVWRTLSNGDKAFFPDDNSGPMAVQGDDKSAKDEKQTKDMSRVKDDDKDEKKKPGLLKRVAGKVKELAKKAVGKLKKEDVGAQLEDFETVLPLIEYWFTLVRDVAEVRRASTRLESIDDEMHLLRTIVRAVRSRITVMGEDKEALDRLPELIRVFEEACVDDEDLSALDDMLAGFGNGPTMQTGIVTIPALGAFREEVEALDEATQGEMIKWLLKIYLQSDLRMDQTSGGGYAPSKGVLRQREHSRQRDEIIMLGRQVSRTFWAEQDRAVHQGRPNFHVGFGADVPNRYDEKWLSAVSKLESLLKRAGYKLDRKREKDATIYVNANVKRLKAAEAAHDEYLNLLKKKGSKGAAKMLGEEIEEAYLGFERLKSKISDDVGPISVAATIGRKKYGRVKFQEAAAKGKKLRGEEAESWVGAVDLLDPFLSEEDLGELEAIVLRGGTEDVWEELARRLDGTDIADVVEALSYHEDVEDTYALAMWLDARLSGLTEGDLQLVAGAIADVLDEKTVEVGGDRVTAAGDPKTHKPGLFRRLKAKLQKRGNVDDPERLAGWIKAWLMKSGHKVSHKKEGIEQLDDLLAPYVGLHEASRDYDITPGKAGGEWWGRRSKDSKLVKMRDNEAKQTLKQKPGNYDSKWLAVWWVPAEYVKAREQTRAPNLFNPLWDYMFGTQPGGWR